MTGASKKPLSTPSFGDRYELLKKLGSGGMGAVYKARDSLLNKDVAMKILLPGKSEDAARRFHHEAKAAARLDHINVVKVLDFGQTPKGEFYLVMDYVGPNSLEDHIVKCGRVPVEEALPIFFDIASGLEHAHLHDVLHRDVKPSNVMLPEDPATGHLQIVDFGLAKLQSNDQRLTSTNARVGSPLYMSPEQARGEDVDKRSDIYSMGCLMFKALTGDVPLQGATFMETLMKQTDELPVSLSEATKGAAFPADLEDLVSCALEKNPKDRFQSFGELKEALTNLMESLEEPEEPVRSPDRIELIKLKSLWQTYRLVVVAVILICVSVGTYQALFLKVEPVEKSQLPRIAHPNEMIFLDGTDEGKYIESVAVTPIEKTGPTFSWLRRAEESDRFHRKLAQSDPQLYKALVNGNFGEFWTESAVSSLWRDRRFSSLYLDMHDVWQNPTDKKTFEDPAVNQFVISPQYWKNWNNAASTREETAFRNNINVQALMKDARFKKLIEDPDFEKMVKDARFKKVANNYVNVKLLKEWSKFGNDYLQRFAAGKGKQSDKSFHPIQIFDKFIQHE